jgi:hypothetical protein
MHVVLDDGRHIAVLSNGGVPMFGPVVIWRCAGLAEAVAGILILFGRNS